MINIWSAGGVLECHAGFSYQGIVEIAMLPQGTSKQFFVLAIRPWDPVFAEFVIVEHGYADPRPLAEIVAARSRRNRGRWVHQEIAQRDKSWRVGQLETVKFIIERMEDSAENITKRKGVSRSGPFLTVTWDRSFTIARSQRAATSLRQFLSS